MDPVTRGATARVFFGLPTGELLDLVHDPRLRALIDEARGRAVPAANLHATLAYLGNVPRGALRLLARIGEALPRTAFVIGLDRVGSFKGARVAWIGPSRAPPALVTLHAALTQRLEQEGFRLDGRPYHPHVTIARHARNVVPTRTIAPIAWSVERLVLYESVTAADGARYASLRTWPLGAS